MPAIEEEKKNCCEQFLMQTKDKMQIVGKLQNNDVEETKRNIELRSDKISIISPGKVGNGKQENRILIRNIISNIMNRSNIRFYDVNVFTVKIFQKFATLCFFINFIHFLVLLGF